MAHPEQESTFVETALKLGGKSEDETRRTGELDRADDQVEKLFAARRQTSASPIHRAVWDRDFPEGFALEELSTPPHVREVMDKSLSLTRQRKQAGELFDEQGKLSDATLRELGQAGYWGLLIPREYGGAGASFASFAAFLTRMATVDPTVANLASVHGCIGAVDPLLAFGNEEQKRRILPGLASGERLSGFALTEPGAGSDLTAMRTVAVRDGDRYLISGEKLFITNAVPGRTIGLVCLVEGKPGVLIAELPAQETEQFRLNRYGLWALKRLHNHGLVFKDFPVPVENLLKPTGGDGLTVAYHGLNRGRVSLCAVAAGSMRVMLASMLHWSKFRRTYGQPIERRELVARRIARLAGYIVAADAMVHWCGRLLDEGFRGEMECIVAKIFGSETQKAAAVELMMKTHGGRSFLRGHRFGDEVHEYLAPCIYEGEGEVLGLAFFKSLVKKHGTEFFEPIGKAMHAAGIEQPNPLNPAHAWTLRKALWPWMKWRAVGGRVGQRWHGSMPPMPSTLGGHARFAAHALQRTRFEIDSLMRRHALTLPDRQCAVADLSQRIQDAVVMLVTAGYAAGKDDLTQRAAGVVCAELRRKLTGRRATDAEYHAMATLAQRIADGGFPPLEGVEPDDLLMGYTL